MLEARPVPTVNTADPYRVRALKLADFRSYDALSFTPDAGAVVLSGHNGAGKTNLLEAISLLAPGRGLRGANLGDFARRIGTGGWAVAAEIDGAFGSARIGTGREADARPGERRLVRVDGETKGSATILGEHLSMLWVTPAMDRLFVEAPSGRRRFLDRLVLAFDPTHATRVAAYEKAMRERTRLLKDGRGDAHWFGALEEQMAEHGVAIAIARRDAVTRLDGAMLEARGEFPAAHIAVEGPVERWLEDMPAAVDVEDRFLTALSEGRRRDQEAGRALLGPHLSDLTVVHLEKEMEAGQCSTGEQKLLLLALVIAQARLIQWERGRAPILLLDEVAAHLDEERRARLFGVLAELGGQCFMTGTDGALFEALGSDADFYSVIAGRLARKDRS